MSYTFPEDYDSGVIIRNQVLSDILFSSNPPDIEQIIKNIPKSKSGLILGMQTDYTRWDTWIKGTLNMVMEYRNNKDQLVYKKTNKGMRQQYTLSQHIIIEQLYNQIIKQNGQINEQQNLIQGLNAKIDIIQSKQLKQSKQQNTSYLVDDWDDITSETIDIT